MSASKRIDVVPFDQVDFHEIESLLGRVSKDTEMVTDRVFGSAAGQDVMVTHAGVFEGTTLYLGFTQSGREVVFPQVALGTIPKPCQKGHAVM